MFFLFFFVSFYLEKCIPGFIELWHLNLHRLSKYHAYAGKIELVNLPLLINEGILILEILIQDKNSKQVFILKDECS